MGQGWGRAAVRLSELGWSLFPDLLSVRQARLRNRDEMSFWALVDEMEQQRVDSLALDLDNHYGSYHTAAFSGCQNSLKVRLRWGQRYLYLMDEFRRLGGDERSLRPF